MSTAILTALGVLAGVVLADLLSQEVRARLDRLPGAIVRLAARRLAPEIRADLSAEWSAELHEVLRERGAEGLPLTRLVVGLRYATGLLRAAGAVDSALSGGRHRRLRDRLPERLPPAPVVRRGAVGSGVVLAYSWAGTLQLSSVFSIVAGGSEGALVAGTVDGLLALGMIVGYRAGRRIGLDAVVLTAWVAMAAGLLGLALTGDSRASGDHPALWVSLVLCLVATGAPIGAHAPLAVARRRSRRRGTAGPGVPVRAATTRRA